MLFDNQLLMVWSVLNYCYCCGNMVSVLEVGENGERVFNVFEVVFENDQVKDMQMGQDKMGEQGQLLDYFL